MYVLSLFISLIIRDYREMMRFVVLNSMMSSMSSLFVREEKVPVGKSGTQRSTEDFLQTSGLLYFR